MMSTYKKDINIGGDTGRIVWTPRGRWIRKSGAKPVVEAQ